MPSIENEYLKIDVTLDGGNLTSIYDKLNNKELLYQPDPRSWQGQDIVIFPFVGAIKDGIYEYEGKKYPIKNHGLCRYMKANLVSQNETSLTVSFYNDLETIKKYPFMFDLKVTYELINNKLIVKYHVYNKDDKKIYFSLGGHPALKVNGIDAENEFKISETTLKFNPLKTTRYTLNSDGSLIEGHVKEELNGTINITKDYIKSYKTIILDAKKLNEVILDTLDSRFIFDIKEFPILAIWTKPGFGDFLCIEPWYGLPDRVDSKGDLKKKDMMISIKPGKSYDASYSITYEKH